MLKKEKLSEKSRAQRHAIISAAISVIEEAGLDGTRLRDVARAAQLTTGAVTHYFDSKDEVLVAALEEVVQSTLARARKGTAASQAASVDDFIARMSAYIPVNEAGRREWRVWLAFWGRAIADPAMRQMHQNYYRAFVNLLTMSLLALGDPSGETSRKSTRQDQKINTAKEAKAQQCADAVIAAIDGIGTRATLDPDIWNADRQRQTLDLLLRPLLLSFLQEGAVSPDA